MLIAVVDAPDWSTSLATMMGIGIGIDYALLMVTRFREWRAAGLDERAATVATLDTAGRAVMVAGSTVVVSMLGLFAMGLSFMRGAALVTILGVLVVMVASITLFPALLGYLGRHVDRLRLPLRRAGSGRGRGRRARRAERARWLRWSRLVERHRVVAAVAGVAVLLALAAPFLGVRFGFPDAGNNREGTSTRQAYDLQAEAFGPGANGPLLLVAELPAPVARPRSSRSSRRSAVDHRRRRGHAAAVNPAGTPPCSPSCRPPGRRTRAPRTSSTGCATRAARRRPRAPGSTCTSAASPRPRSTGPTNIAKRIPLLIGGVVLLSMLLLLVSFRSVAVALKAAVMNLLSVAAAYGVVALVLQGGWAGRLVGIDTETPLPAFVPVLMFAVLFGLSMDYEVFLVSRMREAWLRTGDNTRAIVEGLAGTGRVITAAAAIMVAVFAAFIPSPDVVLKVIGVGMAVGHPHRRHRSCGCCWCPAVMHLLGRANWWMPAGSTGSSRSCTSRAAPRCTCPAQRRPSGRRSPPASGAGPVGGLLPVRPRRAPAGGSAGGPRRTRAAGAAARCRRRCRPW